MIDLSHAADERALECSDGSNAAKAVTVAGVMVGGVGGPRPRPFARWPSLWRLRTSSLRAEWSRFGPLTLPPAEAAQRSSVVRVRQLLSAAEVASVLALAQRLPFADAGAVSA